MRKNYISILSILLVASINIFWATKSPGNKTGSPGDNGSSCAQGGCHSVPATASGVTISSDVPAGGYLDGSTYTLTLRAEVTGAQAWGFELVAEDDAGDKQGSWIIMDNRTQISTQNLTHNNKIIGNDTLEFSVQWTAPTGNAGDIAFYAAVNAANNNGNNSGDNIRTGSLAITQDASAPSGTFELNSSKLKAYPNPVIDRLYFSETLDSYRLIDLTGREVLSGANTDRALLSELQSGLYLLEMNASGQTEVQRLFVR